MREWLLALLLASILSGCTGQKEADNGVVVVTDPDDYSYLQNGTSGLHLHDYWSGDDRLTVLDVERPIAFLVGGGMYSTASIVPDEGVVVPQGTAQVETTLSWTDNSPEQLHGRLELWVRTQNLTEPVLVGEATQGGTLVFTTTLADADLPHQALSAWEFIIRVYSAEAQVQNPATGMWRSYNIQLTLHSEAVRGLEIPLFPGHPDHWGNATHLPFVEGAEGTTFLWYPEPPGCTYCAGGLSILRPDDGTIVPTNAAAVEVTFTNTADTPTRLRLLYHGSDTRAWTDALVSSEAGDTRVYVIPVVGNGDGPYATQSLWAFYFGFEGGDGPYSGQWTMTARVLREMP